jgi:hypothetical protein
MNRGHRAFLLQPTSDSDNHRHDHVLAQTTTRLLYDNTLGTGTVTTPNPRSTPFNQQFRFLLVLDQRAARAKPRLEQVGNTRPAEIA